MRPSVWIALAVVLTLHAPAFALEIFSCGQEVSSGMTGLLVADIVCPGTTGYGVLLEPKAALQLNGHSITGGAMSVYVAGGKHIVIAGPGELVGAAQVGVFAPDNVGKIAVTMRDGVVLHDINQSAIALGQGNKVKLELDDVTIRDNAGSAVADCNGLKLKATDFTVTNNGTGICGDAIKVKRGTITGNGVAGIFSWTARVKLIDSTVSANDPTGTAYDLETTRPPKLVRSTCDHSVRLPPFPGLPASGAPSWAVCTGD
jgi:hypothetical protein